LLFFSADRPLSVIWIGDRGELLGRNLDRFAVERQSVFTFFSRYAFQSTEQQVGDLSLLEFRVMIGSLPRSSRAG
jgi:hypothetical protein